MKYLSANAVEGYGAALSAFAGYGKARKVAVDAGPCKLAELSSSQAGIAEQDEALPEGTLTCGDYGFVFYLCEVSRVRRFFLEHFAVYGRVGDPQQF